MSTCNRFGNGSEIELNLINLLQILPLFLGCEKAPLNSRINITTGRENLTAVAETKLVFNKFQGICNISWSSALLSNREEDIRVLYVCIFILAYSSVTS